MFKSKYILRRFGEADRNGYRSYTDRVIRLNVQSLNEKEREALPDPSSQGRLPRRRASDPPGGSRALAGMRCIP